MRWTSAAESLSVGRSKRSGEDPSCEEVDILLIEDRATEKDCTRGGRNARLGAQSSSPDTACTGNFMVLLWDKILADCPEGIHPW